MIRGQKQKLTNTQTQTAIHIQKQTAVLIPKPAVILGRNMTKIRIPKQIQIRMRKRIRSRILKRMTVHMLIVKKKLIPIAKTNRASTAIITCVVSARVQRGIPAHGILGLHVQHVQIRAQNPMNVNVQIFTRGGAQIYMKELVRTV